MKTIHTLDGEPVPTKRRRWVTPLAVVALSLAAAAIVVVRQRHNGFEPTRAQGTGPAELQTPSAPRVERAPIPVEALPQATPEPVATAGAPSTELVRAAADAGSPAPTSKSRAAPKSTGAAPHPPPAPAHKPQADCDPPYTIDSAGRRIFKVECM
jgi:serine/threonine-protein kinase